MLINNTRNNKKTPLIFIDVVRKPVLISDRKCKAMFLYKIAFHNGQNQFPVAYMLSERYDNKSRYIILVEKM